MYVLGTNIYNTQLLDIFCSARTSYFPQFDVLLLGGTFVLIQRFFLTKRKSPYSFDAIHVICSYSHVCEAFLPFENPSLDLFQFILPISLFSVLTICKR